MLKREDALEHVERTGRTITKSRVYEPLPHTLEEIIDRTAAIDPQSGIGTEDTLDGDRLSVDGAVRVRELRFRSPCRCGQRD